MTATPQDLEALRVELLDVLTGIVDAQPGDAWGEWAVMWRGRIASAGVVDLPAVLLAWAEPLGEPCSFDGLVPAAECDCRKLVARIASLQQASMA